MVRTLRFALLLLVALYIAACQPDTQTSSPPAVTKANPQSKRLLGNFSEVGGTAFLMAPITSNTQNKYLFESSYGSDSKTHNYVFINTDDDATRMLATNTDGVFVATLGLPEDAVRGDSYDSRHRRSATNAAKVDWWVYGVVKKDSDNDRDLDHEDRRVLAVSDAGGAGYTELIEDVEHVFGQKLINPATLKIIYRRANKYLVSTIDLTGRHVVSTQELPIFGTEFP